MPSPRLQIVELLEQGLIPAEKVAEALAATKIVPDGKAWRSFIDQLLLWLGGLALAFAAMFFVAYNWNDIGRFAKFGLVEACLVLAIVAHWKLADRQVAGQVSLFVATILLGVLLALYGQTYQTGADPWQLFCNWALLASPWVVIARFPALWVLWLALINLSMVLYHQALGSVFDLMFGYDSGVYWLIFLCNSLALIVWELLTATWPWLNERWAIRLLAVAGGIPVTWLVLHQIFDSQEASSWAALAWGIWLTCLYLVYRKKRPDLFMLAGGCLSGIVVLLSFLGEHMLDEPSAGSMLFLAVLVIGLGTGAAVWLKKVQQEWQG